MKIEQGLGIMTENNFKEVFYILDKSWKYMNQCEVSILIMISVTYTISE